MPVTDPNEIAALEAAAANPPLGGAPPGADGYPTPVQDPQTIAHLEALAAEQARRNGKGPMTNDDIQAALRTAAVRVPQMAGRAVSDAAFALPNMAGDFGVGVRNLAGKLTGTQSDFDYPSDSYRRGMDAALPGSVPQGKLESLEMALAPAVVGAGATRIPGTVEALAGAPAVATDASQIPRSAASTLPKTASVLLGGATPETKAASAPMFDEGGNPVYVSPETLTSAEQKRQRLVDVLKGGHELGLSVPRATSNPTGWNQGVETWGGKQATQQHFSVHNQTEAQRIMAEYNGLNPDAEITPQALSAVRKEAGQDYAVVGNVGKVRPDGQLRQDLEQIRRQLGNKARDFPGSTDSPVRSEIDSILGAPPAPATPRQRTIAALQQPESTVQPGNSPVVPRGTGPGVDPLTLNPRTQPGIGPLGNPPASPAGPMAAATPGPRSGVPSSPLLTPEQPPPFDAIGAAGNGARGPSNSTAGSRPALPTDPLTLNPVTRTFDSGSIISKVSELRDAADVAGRAGQKQLAGHYKSVADALESQVQREIEKRIAEGDTSVSPAALQKLKEARVRIAKSYTTEDVLKAGGRIDLHALANKVDQGEPITGDARTLGAFASQFRKATMDPAKIGSPGVNHLEGGLGTALTIAGEQIGEHLGKGGEGGGHALLGTLGGIGLGIGIPISRRMAVNANVGNQAAQIPQVIRGVPRPGSAAALAQSLKTFSPNKNTVGEH